MRKKRAPKARIVSVLLVLALLFGNGTIVNASENQEEVKSEVETAAPKEAEVEPIEGKTLEPEEAVVGQESTSLQEEVPTGMGMTVSLQVDGYEDTLIGQVSVIMPDRYKSLKEYGLPVSEANDPGFYTPLHVLAQYCEQTYQDVSMIGVTESGYLFDFMDDAATYPSTGYMFVVNDTYQIMPGYNYGYGINQYPVRDGERINIYNSWYVYDYGSTSKNGNYAWFSEGATTVEQNNKAVVILNTISSFTGVRTNPANAELILLQEDGQKVEGSKYTASKTAANGTGVITIHEPGMYIVTAKRKADYYMPDGTKPYDISHPYTTIRVAASQKPLSDEEAVEKAKESLALGNIEAVTSDVALPATWSYDTVVTWKSSHPSIVSDKGKVPTLRPVNKDAVVTMTATITKGMASSTKSFQVTVKAISLLLKSLTVSTGGLEFDSQKNEYTIYVNEKESSIKISGSLMEEVYTGLSLLVHNGKKEVEIKKDFEGNWSLVEVPLPKEKDTITIPVKVQMYYPANEAITTITVKRAKNPQPSLPELPGNIWGGHLGIAGNNATTNVETPKTDAVLSWESFAGGKDNWGTWYAGSPILINDKMYVARNNQIQMLNVTTGAVEKTTGLLYGLGIPSYITYGGGKIFVPLGNGAVQCFQATTLESLFVTKIPTLPLMTLQAPNSIHYADGMIYVGYSNGATTEKAAAGYFAAYDVADLDIENSTEVITPQWTYERGKTSYYGMGAVTINKGKSTYLVFGGDDGRLVSVNPKTGKELDVIKLDGKIRCGIVNAEEYLWLTTQAGKLYRIGVSSEGTFESQKAAELPEQMSTNASPVVTGEKVYVTGGGWKRGFLALYDKELNLLGQEFTKVQANTPTVSTAYEETYVYFTLNEEAGALYVAHITKDNRISISTLYTPKYSQYSMSNVVVGADGTVYYGNDAGYIFAVKAGVVSKPEGKPEEKPEDKPEGKPESKPEDKPEREPEKTPEINPEKKETETRTYIQTRLVPKKMETVSNEDTDTKKTKSQSVANAIENNAKKGKQTLTLRDVPKKLDAVVFQTLKEYKDMQLILDCGTYTMSIMGTDVIRTDVPLQTELIEKEDTSKKKEQQLEFPQEGALPGAVTVVYRLPDKLEDAKALYLHSNQSETEVKEVVIQEGYGMFGLERAGSYRLSEDKGGMTALSSSAEQNIQKNKMPKAVESIVFSKVIIYIGAAGIFVVGILLGGVIQSKRRGRRDIWEIEE